MSDVLERVEERQLSLELENERERAAFAVEARAIEGAQEVAEIAKEVAREVAEVKRRDFEAGNSGGSHHPNDAIGGQRRLVDLERRRKSDPEITDEVIAQNEAVARYNVRSGLAEIIFKRQADIPKEREYSLDPDTGISSEGGHEIGGLFLNSLSPLNGEEELSRRTVEYSNITTIEYLGSHDEICIDPQTEEFVDVEEVGVIEFSQCSHAEDAGNAYVPEIDKLQIRMSRFRRNADGSRTLLMQPAYISGLQMDDDFLREVAAELSGSEGIEDRVDMLDRMHMVRLSDVSDVTEFVSLLDYKLWLKTGKRHFLGEEIGDFDEVSYDDVPAMMEEKYQRLDAIEEKAYQYTMKLARKGVSPAMAEVKLNKFQKRLVLEFGETNLDLAASAFNQETADQLEELAENRDDMSEEEAERRFRDILEQTVDLQGCPGVCGVRQASTAEVAMAFKAGLKIGKDESLWHYKGGKCPECGARGILVTDRGSILCTKACTKKENGQMTKLKESKDVVEEKEEPEEAAQDETVVDEGLEKKKLQSAAV